MAAPRHALIQPLAALKEAVPVIGCETRPIVIDGDVKPILTPLRPHFDARAAPFAGVIDEIAQHLLQILALAAKHQARLANDLDGDAAIAVKTKQRAPKILDRRGHLGADADDAARGGRARPRQVVIDLAAHRRDLPAHGLGEGVLAALGLVGQHGERRLQRMGEIAHMGPRALHHRGVVLEQVVELVRQRRDLGGEVALEPAGLSHAYRDQRLAHKAQRPQAISHLNEQRDQEAGAEHAQGPGKRDIEAADLRLDLSGAARDDVAQSRRRSRQLDVACHRAKPIAVGIADVIAGGLARQGRLVRRQGLVPQRARALRLHARRRHLPIPSGQRLVEARIAQRGVDSKNARGVDLAAGDQRLEIDDEAGIEAS